MSTKTSLRLFEAIASVGSILEPLLTRLHFSGLSILAGFISIYGFVGFFIMKLLLKMEGGGPRRDTSHFVRI